MVSAMVCSGAAGSGGLLGLVSGLLPGGSGESGGDGPPVERGEAGELDAHAGEALAPAAAGHPDHAAGGADDLAGGEGDLQLQELAHLEEQLGAQEGAPLGHVCRIEVDGPFHLAARRPHGHGQLGPPAIEPPHLAAPEGLAHGDAGAAARGGSAVAVTPRTSSTVDDRASSDRWAVWGPAAEESWTKRLSRQTASKDTGTRPVCGTT